MALTAWRVVRAKYTAPPFDPFDGEGAKRMGGRWNSAGVSAVYTSWSVSLAVLESLVHARKLDSLLEMRIACLTFAESDIEEAVLPGRADDPIHRATRAFGDAWLTEKRTPVLCIPSAVIPQEFNYLLNPEHPDFARIRKSATPWEPLPIDRRLLEVK